MASPPLVDIAALLVPIPGDNPAGGSVPFEIRDKLEKAHKEEDPDDYPPDDPRRPEKPIKADWPLIVKTATETLATTSKDLLVAARLTEGLTRVHGFAGLRDGLHLMRELVEQCWDRINPVIEDNDLEVRAGPFHWLDDADRGARFPHTLRSLPLVAGAKGQYSWHDWRQSQEGKGAVSREDFEKAIQATPLERCQAEAEALHATQEELGKLTRFLNGKMGEIAPGLTTMRGAVGECRKLMDEIVARKRPADAPKSDKPNGEAAAGGAAPSPVVTRADAYRRLAQTAALLRELEPHSPIPYLIQRAVELGALPFPDMIKELVRDAKILTELNRELGIKEAAKAKKE